MNTKILILPFLLLLCTMKANAQCGPTTNLTYQFSTGIHTFGWDAVPDATQYEFMIVESGGFSAPESLGTMTTNSFSTPGGVLSATYDYWIITTCQNGDTHTSAVFTFTIPCPEPTNLSTTNIAQTSATLNWSNPYASDPMYGQGVYLSYRPVGGTWISLGSSTGASYNLSNLTPGTNYEWCVNLNCPYFDSAPIFGAFTTLNPPCPTSVSQNILSITNTSAQLNWTSVSDAQSYTIQYKQSSGSIWTTITTTNSNTTYNLTGLLINTQYNWKIATNCSYGQGSFSPVNTFTTNCVSMNNSASFIQYAQVKTLIRPSGAEPNGYVNYFAPVDAQTGSTVTIKVKAGFVGGNSAHDFAIYLDHNRNGMFDVNEKMGNTYFISNTSTKTYTVTIPASASLGHARLRLVLLKQNQGISMNACVPVGSFGETEDYWLNIVAPPSNKPIVGSESEIMIVERDMPTTEDNEISEVVLSPNPTSGDFTIKSTIGILSYTVFRSTGDIIIYKKLEGSPTFVNVPLEVVPDGIYFVKVTNIYGVSTTQKLLVLN